MVRKKYLGILALSIWLIIIAVFMSLARIVNLEIFFVLYLIGFLIIAELTDIRYGRSYSRKIVLWVIGIGISLFLIIIAKKVLGFLII